MDPDGQAGLRLTINNLRGLRTTGATHTNVDSAALGISAALRRFSLPEVRGSAAAAPFRPSAGASQSTRFADRPRAGSPVVGADLAGLVCAGRGSPFIPALTGGVSFPSLPLGVTYNANIDPRTGAVRSQRQPGTVDWQSFWIGLQFYLPPQGRIFLVTNYSADKPDNAAEFGDPAQVFIQSRLASASLFLDATAAFRFGIEYAFMQQVYADDVTAHNHRGWLSAFFPVLSRRRRRRCSAT